MEYKIFEPIQSAEKPKTETVVLRPEQDKAVKNTKLHFGSLSKDGTYKLADSSKKFLWNAKMRFGKTLCALQLIKEMGVKRVVIVTHRPVVDKGWGDDFDKIFSYPSTDSLPDCYYATRMDVDEEQDAITKRNHIQNITESQFKELDKAVNDGEKRLVFFASMQYLRRSTLVGGDNDEQLKKELLLTDWDLVIIDEAHEGTRTQLGLQVIDTLKKAKTKMLHLSGTPFNLYEDFGENERYTWDYIQEQQAKAEASKHPDVYNPYAELPQMQIYTYSLNQLFDQFVEQGASFKFSEFFRVWTGNPKADSPKEGDPNMPEGAKGRFVHEEEVKAFLDLLCDDTRDTNYPFSRKTYQENFNHSLWIVPGVKEAAALKNLLKEHSVFKAFDVINVAGNEESSNARSDVRKAIGKQPRKKYTITISCGRLTTGVTVPEWTAVLYLKGSEMTSAATYMQTIFRVQSPWVDEERGEMKATCCVFDFAPERTLKMVAETAKFSSMAKKKTKTEQEEDERETQEDRDKETMQAFIDLCPVISLDGGQMKEYDVKAIYKKLDDVYIDRLVRSGFDDNCLYNQEELNKIDPEMLNAIGENGGEAPDERRQPASKVDMSQLTPEQRELIEEARRKRREYKQNHKEWWDGLSPEKRAAIEAEREAKRRAREEFKKRVSNIRGIALRIPLLMYGGADAGDTKEDITIENFTRKIKDESWAEFMKVSKEDFNKIKKCFNANRFVEAGKRYRALVEEADSMHVEERIKLITEIFSYFRNPDKETVLTPWRVVNMHMSQTIGGYNFFNDTFDGPCQTEITENEQKQIVDTIRPEKMTSVDDVTKELFDTVDSGGEIPTRILEINSKTGLYPLYVTYSLYRRRLMEYAKAECIDIDNISVREEQVVWDDIVADNMYVICNTPMAVGITRRTLFGYREIEKKANIKSVNLIEKAKNDQESLIKDLKSEGFWKGTRSKNMITFNAVVGNPPYMVKQVGTSDDPIYHQFMDLGFALSSFATFITPGRFLFRAGKTPEAWNEKILNDDHFKVIWFESETEKIFPNVEIKGGIAVTIRNANIVFGKIVTYTLHNELNEILKKVVSHDKFSSITSIIYHQNKFNLQALYSRYPSCCNLIGSDGKEKRFTTSILSQLPVFRETGKNDEDIKVLGIIDNNRVTRFIEKDLIESHANISKYKVFVAYSNGSGKLGEVLSTPIIAIPGEGHTQSFISFGAFETKSEAMALLKYIKTKFARTMLAVLKVTQHNGKDTWEYVPNQDFSSNSDIDWTKPIRDIDKQLYSKYELSNNEILFIEDNVLPMDEE